MRTRFGYGHIGHSHSSSRTLEARGRDDQFEERDEMVRKMGDMNPAGIRTHGKNTRVSSLRPRGTGGLSSDFNRTRRAKMVDWNVLVAARMTAHSFYPRYGEVLFHELLVELGQATSGCFGEHVLQTIDWNHRSTLTRDRCCQ